jgi:hypothetical protein
MPSAINEDGATTSFEAEEACMFATMQLGCAAQPCRLVETCYFLAIYQPLSMFEIMSSMSRLYPSFPTSFAFRRARSIQANTTIAQKPWR